MYVYLESEPGLFTAGFYDPSGRFQPESDHDHAQDAAKRVAFLNGNGPSGADINFSVVAVILERFRRYSPKAFVDECFKQYSEPHRQHLLTKFPDNGNILEMLHKLDEPHIREVNKFLNSLLPAHERLPYESYM